MTRIRKGIRKTLTFQPHHPKTPSRWSDPPRRNTQQVHESFHCPQIYLKPLLVRAEGNPPILVMKALIPEPTYTPDEGTQVPSPRTRAMEAAAVAESGMTISGLGCSWDCSSAVTQASSSRSRGRRWRQCRRTTHRPWCRRAWDARAGGRSGESSRGGGGPWTSYDRRGRMRLRRRRTRTRTRTRRARRRSSGSTKPSRGQGSNMVWREMPPRRNKRSNPNPELRSAMASPAEEARKLQYWTEMEDDDDDREEGDIFGPVSPPRSFKGSCTRTKPFPKVKRFTSHFLPFVFRIFFYTLESLEMQRNTRIRLIPNIS